MLTPAEYYVIELDLVFFVGSPEKSLRVVWFLHALPAVIVACWDHIHHSFSALQPSLAERMIRPR
jgi:hypothetical protein